MSDGFLPHLHELVEEGKLQELDIYLQSLTSTELKHEINEVDGAYETPLHIAFGRKKAANSNLINVVQHPVYSAELQKTFAEDKATLENYSAIIDLLLQYGANPYHVPNVPLEDRQKRSPAPIELIDKLYHADIDALYKKYTLARGEQPIEYIPSPDSAPAQKKPHYLAKSLGREETPGKRPSNDDQFIQID